MNLHCGKISRAAAGLAMLRPSAVIVSVGLTLLGCASASPDFPDPDLAGVDGDVVVAVVDGDFRASSYATQALAPLEAEYRDAIVVWRRGVAAAGVLPVSNSVTSPPEVLAVSPDGRFAYVVERLGQRSPGVTRVPDLPAGGRLSAISLEGGEGSAVDLGEAPEALDLRSDGRMLAAVSNTPERSLVHLIPVTGGRLGAPIAFDLSNLGVRGQADAPRGGVTATTVFWSPDGRTLAITFNTQDRVAFFRLEGPETAPRLVPWGPPVATGRDPFTGRFTPDGRHFLTLDWGRNFGAARFEDRFPTEPSRVSLIRLEETGAHRRLGDAPTDLNSEGIAVSPGGDLVAVVSMRGTAFLRESARYTPDASVVLLHLDPTRGVLTPVDRVTFDGALPEGASFDREGRRLLVTAFERRDEPGGGLYVFEIRGSGRDARLTQKGVAPTPPGVHHVVVR